MNALSLFIAEAGLVAETVAISKRRAERNGLPHPIGRIGPQDGSVAHGLDKVGQIPMQYEAGDHGIEQVDTCRPWGERRGS